VIYASNVLQSARGSQGLTEPSREYSPTDEFLDAALASRAISEAHVLTAERSVSSTSPSLQRYVEEKRITAKPSALLPMLVEEHQYIWVSPLSSFGSTCALRRGLGHVAFPICGIVHSVWMADLMGRMIGDVVRSEACDAMIVTNGAAGQAFQSAWAGAAEWLRDEAGVRALTTPWIEKIPIPVDLAAFGGSAQRYSRDLLQLPADRAIVLCPGRVLRGRHDEPDPLVSALESLIDKYPRMMLLIGGAPHGQYSKDTAILAQELKLTGRLKMIVDVPVHLKRHLYASADIFVSTDDVVQEDQGLTALEAMAAGLPVVVSDWGGSRELVEDGVNGYLVPTYWNPVAGVMMSWLSECTWAPQFLSDRTIVDVRRLRDALDALLAQSERQVEFGQQARATIERTRSFTVVGRQLRDLWTNQQAALAKIEMRVREAVINYTAMFRPYATAELNLDLELQVGPQGGRLLGDELSGPDTRDVPLLLRASASQILERVRLGPVTIRACVEAGSEFTFEAIVWLLRKGMLSCDDASMRTPLPAAVL